MTRFSLVLLALMGAVPAVADPSARLQGAFVEWMDAQDVENGVLFAQKDGEPAIMHARGWAQDAPVVLASLSKSITAACVAVLVDRGELVLEDTSADILGYGAEGITVAQLLTHASGLGPDQTQGVMFLWHGVQESRAAEVAQRALSRSTQQAEAGRYSYNNENYAILGEIISEVSGAPYAQTCRTAVLEPAGLRSAEISAQVGATLPFGGWEMSVQDFARFLEWAYGPSGIIGGQGARWPAHPLNAHVAYGMGMFQRSNGSGYNYWHFGAFCFPFGLKTGSYGVRWGNGWRVVAAYDRCLGNEQMIALDRAMVGAVFE